MRSGQFGIYKKSAAGQISFIPPTYNDDGYLDREGSVFVEATKSTGVNDKGMPLYDWSQKISFSMGMNDLALLFGSESARLTHEYKGNIKNFHIKPGEGKYEGTYQLQLFQKDPDGAKRDVMVPLTGGEMAVLGRLLDRATYKIIGW